MKNRITKEKLERYFSITKKALKKIKIAPPEGSHLRGSANDFLSMIESYLKDAEHFYANGDWVNSFAALNYLYGWIDAGVRIGLFDGEGHNKLFAG